MTRKHRNYSEDEVVASLKKKKDIKISHEHRQIIINADPERRVGDIGNGTRGKLDFMRKYCGWHIYYQS